MGSDTLNFFEQADVLGVIGMLRRLVLVVQFATVASRLDVPQQLDLESVHRLRTA